MSVQFILGRSGTGKTSYCIKAVIDALLEPSSSSATGNQPLILLVPEQASYQAERAILGDKRVLGYSRLNVLSFNRLQFLLLGKNTARPELSRIGQQMLVHKTLRDNKSKLKVLWPSANRPGLGRQMAQTVAELHREAKTPEDIVNLLGELQKNERNNLTASKFADISLVLKEYLEFIKGKFIDPDVQLTLACRAVAEAEFISGAKLWVDGFASFTASELAILAELLKASEDAQIALCLDPSEVNLPNPDTAKLNPVSLFNPTERTYATLIDIIKKCRLQLAKPIIFREPVRFSRCRQLAHIERNLFDPEPTKIKAGDNIRIVSAPNARAEVQFVARQILQLVKEGACPVRKSGNGKDTAGKGKISNGACRYRDIAVIASDLDYYQHYIRAYFADYNLPFFIDKRKSLNQHPVIQLICSALQVVTDGFSSSDIFAYLKSGLVPGLPIDDFRLTIDELKSKIEDRKSEISVDLLENYCLAFGISGADWQSGKDWHFAREQNHHFDEQRVNQIRQKVSVPLLKLRDGLCPDSHAKKISGRQFTQIIFDFLDSLRVGKRIAEWTEEAVEQKNYAAVDEHRQFYERLVGIFDELVEVFSGQQVQCSDFVAIINSAFSQLELAFIPPTLDQVLVGSIERSRHPDLKAVFLIGATQRQFPAPITYKGILTDDDRNAAESADFSLAATTSQALAERQYLAYIAFTRPSQLLCVTYPLADDKGSPTVRSQFVTDLESLFENLYEESITTEQVPIDDVHNEIELAELLCDRLGKDTSRGSSDASHRQLGRLLDGIYADERLANIGSTVKMAINYDNLAKLDKDVVEKLFGRQIESSATKLSTFAACPYQYFARYILELEERKEFKLRPLDIGDFYHRVLDGLLKQLNSAKKDFATIENKELLEILSGQIAELVQTDSFISNFKRHSPHNAYIIDSVSEILEDCVPAIAQMVRVGSFKPTMSEVSFGKTGEGLGEYKLGLSNNRLLALRGKIDRFDVAEANGEKIAVVFDYKRKEKSFSWSEFYYGLNMQLPIYILAVRNATRSKAKNATGAFYMPVEVSPAKTTLGELLKKTSGFDYKAKGIFNGKFALQLDRTASKDSEFYNFFVTKDGKPYGYYSNRAALKPDDFEKMLKFSEGKIIELAERIVSGEIDVKPYRLSGKSPCSYCEYKSLCRFDWQINNYNSLESLEKTEILEKMGTVDGWKED